MNAISAAQGEPQDVLYPRLRIRAGDCLWIGPEQYLAQSRHSNKWILVNLETMEPRVEHDVDLIKMIGSGSLRYRSRPITREALSPIAADALGEDAKAATLRKHAYVMHALEHAEGYRNNKAWLRKPIAEMAAELGDANPPSPSSIIGWVKLYQANYNEVGLAAYAARNDLKGRRGRRLPDPMTVALGRSVECYLQGGSISDAQLEAQKYIDDFNQTAEGRAFC